MSRLSLTARLLILMLIAIAPALGMLLYTVNAARSEAIRDLHKAAFARGQTGYQDIMRVIGAVRSTLEVLSEDPTVRSGPPEDCSAFLAAVERRLPMLANIVVLDRQGGLRCSAVPSAPQNFADRYYFRHVRDTGLFTVGTYITDRITGRGALPLALPAPEGRAFGVIIVGLLDLEWLDGQLKERDYSEGNALTVADRDGVIIAREPYPERFVGRRIPPNYVYLVNAPAPGTLRVESQDGTERVIGYYPAKEGVYVSAGLSVTREMQPVTVATTAGIAAGLLAVAGLTAAIWLAGNLLIRRPAARLYRTVMAWRLGNAAARTGMRGRGELEMIGTAIDEFMDELSTVRKRRQEDEHLRELLIRELDHRIKNLLATVQAVARQTLQPGRAVQESAAIFQQRIQAMAGAHQLLTRNWQSAPLRLTVTTAIAPFNDSRSGTGRFRVEGPELQVNAGTALSLSMALHELCTNAAKYGALSRDEGSIRICWEVTARNDGDVFTLVWSEEDGPPVTPPSREGFGTLMIERVLSQQLGGSVTPDYRPEGLAVTIRAPGAKVVVSEAGEPATGEAEGARALT